MLLPYLKKTYIGIIFFLLSLMIVLIWFKSGLYYGGAEVGVGPYYHPSRYLDIQKSIWWDSTAPGGLVPQFIAGVPLYFILSLLENISSPLILQAVLFFCLLFMMGFGMYLFASSFLDKNKTFYAFLAGLFYMFNSYMMVAVWHRFLYTGFFLGASLPILALFWKLWIDKGKFIFLFLFLLTNLVFVYMYANLTSTLVVWILCFLLTIAKAIFPWQGKKSCLNITFKFLLGLSLFLLTNLWWLIPVFKVSTGVLSQQHNIEDDISTLVNISKQTILPFTLQFANPFYLFYTQELGGIYTNFIFQILPWLPTTVIFIGILQSLKNKMFASLGLFYLLFILIVKGATSPFGYPYIWGFMNFFALGVIRNPFEKLGILLPFFGSLLFIVGLEALIVFCTKRFGKPVAKLLVGIILISILIYAFPMFTGGVFNKPDYPLKVKVPGTYEQANNWFRMQKNLKGNILHLPFPDKDVVTYNWEHGYHGVEINEILFTALPSITRNVGIKRVDDTLKSLSFIFNKSFLNKDQILSILQSLNVEYIALHKDTKWDDIPTYGKSVSLNNPSEMETTLNNLDFLEKKAIFGDLIIYQLKDHFYEPKIVVSNNYDLVNAGESNIMQTLSFSQSNKITSVDKEVDEAVWRNASSVLIFPETIFYDWEPSKGILENILNQNTSNPNDGSLPFNELQAVKQRFFSQSGELLSLTLLNKIILASNNILELNKIRLNPIISAQQILDNYSDQIDTIFTKNFNGSSLQRIFNILLAKVFTIHLYVLERFYEIGNTSEQILAKKIHDKLNEYLVNNKVLPKYFSQEKQEKEIIQRRVHSFDVPKKDTYELLLTDADMLKLYPNISPTLNIQLDGKDIPTKVSILDKITHLTEVELDKGIHEISYIVESSTNLAANFNKFILQGKSQLINNQTLKLAADPQNGSIASVTLSDIKGGDSYEITFEGLDDNMDRFYIEMMEDTQSDNVADSCIKFSCYTIEPNQASKDWQKFSITTTPLNLATRLANLKIILPITPSSTSTILIRNLQVNRIMDNNLVLRKISTLSPHLSTSSAQLSEFRRISSVKYEGIIIVDSPSLIFFKETFNPGWILKLSNDKENFRIDRHFLGDLYGNTYYIDKTGEYNFKLEFEPQEYVNYGITLSVAGWVMILVILLLTEFRRKYEV